MEYAVVKWECKVIKEYYNDLAREKSGDMTRIVSKFLWCPMTLRSTTKWLCVGKFRQELKRVQWCPKIWNVPFPHPTHTTLEWEDKEWINENNNWIKCK